MSRIGKVAATTTATTLIEAFNAERIVFTGVAGALGADVRVGDVVVASHFVQHDMDASPLFPRFEIPLYRQTQFACDIRLATLLTEACRRAMVDLPRSPASMRSAFMRIFWACWRLHRPGPQVRRPPS